MGIIVQLFLNIVIDGAIYALVALGFNLIYSTARFFDLGYGAIMVAAGYAMFYLYDTLGLGFLPSFLLAVFFAGALGFVIEKLVYRPLRKRKATSTALLIASLGVLTVLQAIIAILFTSQYQTLFRAASSERIFSVFGGAITQTQTLMLAASVVIMLILGFVLRYTLFGKAVRAVADDEEVSQIVGINSERLIGLLFFIGAAIGGVAGIATGFDTGLEPTIGLTLLLKGIIAAIIGGIGSAFGGVIGAFILAIVENTGVWYLSTEWRDAIAFAVLTLFLIFRPQGLWPR
jgi:branched-chain amino acid transport system permease protein